MPSLGGVYISDCMLLPILCANNLPMSYRQMYKIFVSYFALMNATMFRCYTYLLLNESSAEDKLAQRGFIGVLLTQLKLDILLLLISGHGVSHSNSNVPNFLTLFLF